jgi:hypothetical protein
MKKTRTDAAGRGRLEAFNAVVIRITSRQGGSHNDAFSPFADPSEMFWINLSGLFSAKPMEQLELA